MSSRSIRIGFLGAATLCLLRVGIGWHFFQEGAKKFQGDSFTAQYFLEQATGPWSDYFQSWIPDRFGVERLDSSQTIVRWAAYHDRMVKHYQLDAKQAQAVLENQKKQLAWFHAVNADDIQEYLLELSRYQAARIDRVRDVQFQKDRIAKKSAELKGQVSPWLGTLKKMDAGLEDGLYALVPNATGGRKYRIDQTAYLPVLNTTVKYVVIVVGILLILGLFTRVACLAGAAFLLSVMATQPPWIDGAVLTHFYYQYVEVLALAVVAVFRAGYFGGLDYILRGIWNYRRENSLVER
ncbi:MAG: DoxX family protein [Planctomycetota bacterium]|nr:DoxX family protein [Planctomycetota bacterium]